jgi:hypothetical protein
MSPNCTARPLGGLRPLLATLLVTSAAASALPAQTIDTLAIRGHTRFLADDLLAGRGTGTDGERLAAAYVVSQAKRLGLSPLDAASFLLPVPMLAATVDAGTSVVVRTGADTAAFRSGDHFVVNTGGRGAFRDFEGPLRFFGEPESGAALVAGATDLEGSVAVFVGALGASALDIVPALIRGRAAGVVLLVPDAEQYDLFVRSRSDTRYIVDADVDDPVWQPDLPVLLAGPELTAALLGGAELPAAILDGTATAPVDLRRSMSARIRTSERPLVTANVAAVLRGSDAALRDEYIVYTAHLDHLGIGLPDEAGDSIYNGFSDNAAGVGMLLAIAEALRDSPPARSVLFLFFTGEERGLLGSSYFAAHAPLPLERIRAVINLDAGAPPAPPVSWRIAGTVASPLADAAVRVAERNGWNATVGAAGPNSDHWPFHRRGVPAIFVIPGQEWENVTPAERQALRQRWDRYHLPADHWDADFPFAGLARYAEYALRIGLEVAGQ